MAKYTGICVCLVLTMCCVSIVRGGGTFNGGGASGNSGSLIVSGTGQTSKIILGRRCMKATSAATTMDMVVNAWEADNNIKYINSNVHIRYDECTFLDAVQYLDSNMRVLPAAGDRCALARVDSSTPYTGTVQQNLWVKRTTIDHSDNGIPKCGAKVVGNVYHYVVRCLRKGSFEHLFDATFHFTCDLATALVKQQDSSSLVVGDPLPKEVKRNWGVVPKLYLMLGDPLPAAKQADTTHPSISAITGPLDLGKTIFMEVCLTITDSDRLFFTNHYSPIGLRLFNCVAELEGNNFDATHPNFDTSAERQRTVVDANGCGTTEAPMLQWNTTSYVFKWLDDGRADTTLDWLMSPNCFRSPGFEVVAWQRKNYGQSQTTKLTCEVDYCMGSNDTKCFGDVQTADLSDGYPTCGPKRKRREDGVIHDTISASFTVKLPDEPAEEKKPVSGCFQRDTFVILTSVMSVLLLLVMLVIGFLFYKLRAVTMQEQDGSFSSSSDSKRSSLSGVNSKQSSLSGVHNKAYY